MATTFRPCEPDQMLLLAPDVREWLPEGHFAHHVSDLVDGLDLTAFYAPYEGDGRRIDRIVQGHYKRSTSLRAPRPSTPRGSPRGAWRHPARQRAGRWILPSGDGGNGKCGPHPACRGLKATTSTSTRTSTSRSFTTAERAGGSSGKYSA